MVGTIIVAVLSLIGTLAGAYWANQKSTALIAYRLDRLEEKVNRHNQVIERTYNLEQRVAIDEVKLEQLERYHE